MTKTPHLDAAIRAAKKAVNRTGRLFGNEYKDAAIAALRAAIPEDPSAEEVEAMSNAISVANGSSIWDEQNCTWVEHENFVEEALAAYRARPIWKELWDAE